MGKGHTQLCSGLVSSSVFNLLGLGGLHIEAVYWTQVHWIQGKCPTFCTMSQEQIIMDKWNKHKFLPPSIVSSGCDIFEEKKQWVLLHRGGWDLRIIWARVQEHVRLGDLNRFYQRNGKCIQGLRRRNYHPPKDRTFLRILKNPIIVCILQMECRACTSWYLGYCIQSVPVTGKH